MELSWPNILRVVSNLDSKFDNRFAELEDVLFLRSCPVSNQQDLQSDFLGLYSESLESPEVTTLVEQSTGGRLEALEARVAGMSQAFCRMRVTLDDIKEQFRIQKRQAEELISDGRLTLLEESISDVFIAVHRESDARQKQVSGLDLELKGLWQHDCALQEQVERLAERVDSGLNGLTGLADLKLGPLSTKVQALETKSGTLARIVKLIAEQACVTAAGCNGLRYRPQEWSFPEEMLRWLSEGMDNMVCLPQQEELGASVEDRLRGKVRRLVQQFGGSPRALSEDYAGGFSSTSDFALELPIQPAKERAIRQPVFLPARATPTMRTRPAISILSPVNSRASRFTCTQGKRSTPTPPSPLSADAPVQRVAQPCM